MNPAEDTKARSLASRGALHPHPGRVRDHLFQRSDFFDPRDLVQVRYEMLRRHLVDGQERRRVGARGRLQTGAAGEQEQECGHGPFPWQARQRVPSAAGSASIEG